MRRNLLAVASLVLIASVPLGDAAAQRRVVPYFGVGLASGVGDLSDGTEMGYGLFAGLDWAIASKPGMVVGLGVSWTRIPYEGGYDAATNIPAASFDVGYLFGATSPSKVKPYVRAGIGVLQHRYDPGDLPDVSSDDTQLFAAGGVGLEFILRSTALFTGAHLINGFDDTSFVLFYGGIAFSGSSASSLRNFLRR